MRTTLFAILTCSLIASIWLLSMPAAGATNAGTNLDSTTAITPTAIMPIAALIPEVIIFSDKTTEQVVTSCMEPSPCQTHADCDYPHGICLPNLNYPQTPSPKSCICIPDNL